MAQAKSTKSGTENKTAAEHTIAAAKAPVESKYSTADLVSAARVRFGVLPEVMQVALKVAGKTEATLTEATEIVKNFLDRQVTQ